MIILAITIFLLSLFLAFFKKTVHRWHLRRAKKILRKLDDVKMSSGQKIVYLRKINPFVFEELVLLGFARHGYKTIRNQRYTGDGGIDGRVVKDGKTYLIQCKRYAGHINPEHVRAFVQVCENQHKAGYFVHTGKTGAKSWEMAKENGRLVTMISGERLLLLLSEGDKK